MLTCWCGFNSGARADRRAITRSDFARKYARICGRTVTFVVSIISLRAMVLQDARERKKGVGLDEDFDNHVPDHRILVSMASVPDVRPLEPELVAIESVASEPACWKSPRTRLGSTKDG